MTTFATLKSDIDNFYPHSDITDALKGTFVTLCESDIRRKLRVQAMETTDTAFSQTAQSTALPDGFITMRSVTLNETYKRDLDYLPPNRLRSSGLQDSASSTPVAYTIEGRNLVLMPWSATVTLQLVYLKAFDALNADEDTNWALTNAYDLYLYGTLKHAALFAQDDAAVMKYTALFADALQDLNREGRWSRVSGDKLARTGGRTP